MQGYKHGPSELNLSKKSVFSDIHTVDYAGFTRNVVSPNFSDFSAFPVWSRNPPDSGGLEDLVIHRVADGHRTTKNSRKSRDETLESREFFSSSAELLELELCLSKI